jgi:hypothetical protein
VREVPGAVKREANAFPEAVGYGVKVARQTRIRRLDREWPVRSGPKIRSRGPPRRAREPPCADHSASGRQQSRTVCTDARYMSQILMHSNVNLS